MSVIYWSQPNKLQNQSEPVDCQSPAQSQCMEVEFVVCDEKDKTILDSSDPLDNKGPGFLFNETIEEEQLSNTIDTSLTFNSDKEETSPITELSGVEDRFKTIGNAEQKSTDINDNDMNDSTMKQEKSTYHSQTQISSSCFNSANTNSLPRALIDANPTTFQKAEAIEVIQKTTENYSVTEHVIEISSSDSSTVKEPFVDAHANVNHSSKIIEAVPINKYDIYIADSSDEEDTSDFTYKDGTIAALSEKEKIAETLINMNREPKSHDEHVNEISESSPPKLNKYGIVIASSDSSDEEENLNTSPLVMKNRAEQRNKYGIVIASSDEEEISDVSPEISFDEMKKYCEENLGSSSTQLSEELKFQEDRVQVNVLYQNDRLMQHSSENENKKSEIVSTRPDSSEENEVEHLNEGARIIPFEEANRRVMELRSKRKV